MTKQHKISWLNIPGYIPETWNPIVGCTKVSEGCDHCYAERMAFRLANMELSNHGKNGYYYGNVVGVENGKWLGTTLFFQSRLEKPLQWKKPRAIFVCSMGDLFHETVSPGILQMILARIATCRPHIFIILTKRPENIMPKMKKVGWGLPFPPNVWIGVTAENQQQANQRIPILLSVPAAKHFVSIEPMLGEINLGVIHHADAHIDALNGLYNNYPDGYWKQKQIAKLDWVIVGGETGPGARPMHPDWVRTIRDQCSEAKVPFFFKQWGKWQPFSTVDGVQKMPFGNYCVNPMSGFTKNNKFFRNDVLDGQQYHQFPTITND